MISRLFYMSVDIFSYGAAAIVVAVKVVQKLSRASKLDVIPTVGSNVIQEGYEKHKPAPFKVAELLRWVVILSSREHVEELRKAPEDTLSFAEAMNDQIYVEYTLGREIHHNPYHLLVLRSQLTRNLGVLHPEIRNEIITAFDDILGLKGSEWKSVLALSNVQKIFCRTSNRFFVGLPLCRDPDWIDLNIQYTVDIIKARAIVGLFPGLLKPIAAQFLTNIGRDKQRGMKLLGPIIEDRRRCLIQQKNEWAEKPNDFLSWLMEEAEGPESTVKSLTSRILAANVAAVHTSSSSFTHTLFYLAANPQYVQPLREEVKGIIEREGWSKSALDKMQKVDSFLKECQRIEGNSGVSLSRKALKDFTFSDGTFVPRGTLVVTAMRSIHHDEALYENARTFEPFRFADLCEEDSEGVKHLFVTTTPEYLSFGHGRRACPGRFLAATELKTMLAHVVVTYDVKLEDNAAFPQSLRYAAAIVPDPRAKVMFRRRVD